MFFSNFVSFRRPVIFDVLIKHNPYIYISIQDFFIYSLKLYVKYVGFDDIINKIVFILDIMIMSAMESKREK